MKLNSHKRLALVLVPLGILLILAVLNQTDRAPEKDGRVAAVGENPAPEPEGYKAKPVGPKGLVAKQSKPAAPAPLTRRQPANDGKLGDRVPFLTDSAIGDPLDIALNYVRTPENQPGYTEADFKNLKISSRYVSKHNGVTHLYLRQSHEGIEVYGGDIGVSLMPDGSIINLHNAFVTDLASEVNRIDPVITAQEAIRSAATFYSLQETAALAPLEVPEPDPVAKKQLFSPAGISLDPIPVKLTYVPLEEGVTRLAWNAVIRFNDGERWLDLNVDAETGEVLSEANWIACVKCAAHGVEIGEAHDCGEETPAMASETSSVTGTNYNVFPLPLESPSDGGRSVLIDPQNTAASPFGWHDTNGAAGAEFTDTRGNNVNAQEDADNNDTGGVRPSGGASLNFNFPLDLAQAPSTYTPAVTANLFYWNNIIHDVFWHYGFDEPAGNFQENNYGNGGAASDPVEADSQDGSGTNNANFGTPPDGSNPRMQMYIWTQATPDRDSSLDNGVIIHEYGHGISNRLTGGPANSSALSASQSRGMGEGWSDFLALALTHQAGDTGVMGRGIGTYVLGQPTTGAGIRPYRYSTDLAVNPQHFGNLNGGGLSVPHGVGSVWCTTLWELYWALVGVHGYDPNLYAGTGGNNIALQLVIDGMKLQPANPSFLDARDAILTADQVNNGGANFDTIWAAFAKRGMGFSAYDGGSSSSLAVTAAFDLPDDLNITPGPQASLVSTGPAGGPFVPSSQTYTLENIGGASLNWTVSDNVTWLDLSAASGTLASSATTTVNATINANANVLGLGIHSAIVTFTNTISGKTMIRNVSLYVNDFAAALDSPALTFGTSGVPWFSQTTTTQDGVDAAQSGVIGDSLTSSLQTTLTGPGQLTFWWKVSSEANFDFLRFYINNVEQTGSLAKISGNVNWVQRTVSIPSGSHTVRWSYTKDESATGGSDAAWLDQLVWLPLPLNTVEVSYPNGGETVLLGSTQTISWAANITGNVKIDLFKGGSLHSVLAANESNDGSYSWVVSAGLPAASDYTIKVSSVNNPAYSDTSDATFTIMPQPTLADALDTTGLTWLTSGNVPWFSQTTTTNDGVDAARSGAITHSQSSSVETTLTGSGQLTFWWKVSSESNFDFLRFYINNVEQSGSLVRISGDVNWVQKTVAIPAGSQTVKWSYTKDGSVNSGSDAAWVDQVVFTPTSAPEIAVEQPVGTDLVDGIASINCGSANVGSSASPITFTVKNLGTADLTGLSISKDGAHNTDFTVGSLGATTLAPAASTTFTVTFAPGAAGGRTAAIHIASNDANENPFDISLTGTGIGPGTLEIIPAGGLTSSGNFGGPFSPSTLQYTLNNPGNSSIDWTVVKTAEWVTLDATSGTLAAGASTTVTASINSNANTLNIGSFSDTVSFTNTTNGSGDTTRGVSLTVNPIPATFDFSNLLQTYDRSPKPVTVTTTPSGLAHSVTYNGSSTVPTNGGTYAVVATITAPNYAGSGSTSLTISKASQTINFAALSPVLDDAGNIVPGATATSDLPVSYGSSNTNVATISGSTVNIVGLGTSTITATQAGDTNYNAATSVPQTLTVVRSNPLAVTGGPYNVLVGQTLSLNGGASEPSYTETITAWDWDLNNDNTFGDVTGATPAAISYSDLTGIWGRLPGPNTIQLKVTDSAGKTSITSTTLTLITTITWDANGTTANQTDGAGAWLNANQWWTGSANTTWSSNANAIFGFGGAGGAVTLASPTTINSLTFNSFITTAYTLGTAGQAITLNTGITKNAGSFTATIISPVTLGGIQTWTNNSANNLNVTGGVDNGGNTLTIDGTGQTSFSGALASVFITGSGGLTKNGTGYLALSGAGTPPTHNYSGKTTINGGTVLIQNGNNSTGTGNLEITNGILECYFGGSWTRAQGTVAGEVQITGGTSGFSGQGGTGTTFSIGANATWGSATFNPTVFLLGSPTANANGKGTFSTAINLNGSNRVITSTQNTDGAASSGMTISGIISNSTGTAGFEKTGVGNLILGNASNSFNGPLTITGGWITAAATGALGSASNSLVFNGGTLRATGTITSSATRAVTMTATGIIDNNGQAISIAGDIGGLGGLTKNGTGTLSLSGTNSYGGVTTVNAGTLAITKEATLASNTAANLNVKSGATLALNVDTAGSAGFTVSNLDTLLGNISVANTAAQGLQAGAILGFDTSTATAGTFTPSAAITNSNGAFGGVIGLTKLGAGTLVLNQVNTYTGQTTISAGTLRLDAGGVIATPIVNNATFSINSAGSVTQGTHFGLIMGTGAVTNTGAGTLTLNLANNYSGLTTASAGTIALTNALAIQNSALVTTSGTTTLGAFSAVTIGGLSGATGDLGSANVLNGFTGNVSALTLNPQTGVTVTYGGIISNGLGAMTLTKTGAGTQILTGANTYTGATIVNAGTLTIGAGGSLSSTDLQINGGTFIYGNTGANQTMNGLTVGAGNSTVSNTASGRSLALGSITRTAGIFGTVNFANLTGSISTTRGNANSIIGPWATTGTTTTLRYAVASPDGTTPTNISALTGTTATANTLVNVTDATLNYEYSAAVAGMDAGLSLTGNTLRYSGGATGTAINATSTLTLNGLMQAGTGLLTISGGPSTGGILIGSTGELVIAANAQATTISAAIGGTGRLVYSGAASTLTLSSTTNAYDGGTVINSGTLTVTANTNLGAASGGITLNGGQLRIAGANISAARIVTVNGTGSSMFVNKNNNFATTGKLTGAGTLATLDGGGSGTNSTYSFNSTANDFTGRLIGTNTFINVNSFADSTNNIVLDGATFTYATGAAAATSLPNRVIELSGTTNGATINNNNTTAANTLTIGGGLLVTGVGNKTLTLAGTNTGANTFGGNISDGPGSVISLSKSGLGTWVLGGNNTYSGQTTVSAGTLRFANGALGSIGMINASGGTLQWGSGNTQDISSRLAMTNATTTILDTNGNDVIFATAFGGNTTGALTKNGAGSLVLNGSNTYTGITSISAGKLFINGSLSDASVALTVSSGATLGGTGTIGRNVTIAAGGSLEFNLSTNAANHDKLDLGAAKTLTFSGASALTITSSGGASSGIYTLVTAPGGIVGSAPATLSLPAGWTGSVSKLGNDLVLNVTVPVTTPPTLVSIADDKSGGPIVLNTLVTYTVSFSEDMDASSVTAEDFGNAGSSASTIGSITETSPGLFTVQVTPTSPGSLQLQVNAGAVLKNVAGNNLDTTSAIADNTIITVQTSYAAWAGGEAFAADANNDGVANGVAWVLGAVNPSVNASGLLPTSDNTTDPDYFIYTYRRSDAANTAPGTTIAVQYGSDLSAWTTAVHDGTNIIITPTDNFHGTNPGIDKVEVKIKRTLATGGKLFSRLNVLLAP